jgi:hypothetical protein
MVRRNMLVLKYLSLVSLFSIKTQQIKKNEKCIIIVLGFLPPKNILCALFVTPVLRFENHHTSVFL